MLRIGFFKIGNVIDGITGHFLINVAGLGADAVIFQHFGHIEAVLDRSQTKIFGKRVLVIR